MLIFFSVTKRSLQLSDDEDDNLKKTKNPDDLSALE